MTIGDAALAKRLLESTLGGTPALEVAQYTDLLALAESLDEDENVIYPKSGLQRAASLGWQYKAALTANQYDLGGGQGKTLDRSQWFDHCMRMSAAYASGAMRVTGSTGGSIGSIGLTTGLDVWTS